MKTSIRIASTAILFLTIAFSCSKDKTVTPASVTNGTLLAGASGQSKTWKLTAITEAYSETGYQTQTYTYSVDNGGLPSCVSDNIFTFSNNSTQDYSLTEGSTLCNASVDVSNIESGSWALTNDGKNLLIDSYNNISSDEGDEITTSGSDQSYLYDVLFSVSRTPLTVVQLTATAMILNYAATFTDSDTNQTVTVVITLAFSSGS